MFIYSIKNQNDKVIMTCLFSVQEKCTGAEILFSNETVNLLENSDKKQTSLHSFETEHTTCTQVEGQKVSCHTGDVNRGMRCMASGRHSCAINKGLYMETLHEITAEVNKISQCESRKIRYKPCICGNRLGKALIFTRQNWESSNSKQDAPPNIVKEIKFAIIIEHQC